MIREIAISPRSGALFRREFAALLRLPRKIGEAPKNAWPLERPFVPDVPAVKVLHSTNHANII